MTNKRPNDIILTSVLGYRNFVLLKKRCDMLLDLKEVFLTEGANKEVDGTLDLSKIILDGTSPGPEPVRLRAQAQNRAGIVRLRISAAFVYRRPCDRCAADTARDMSFQFEHTLVVSLSGSSSDDYVETPDYKLDLDELATADILLELPLKHLCKPDCKGLCPDCGADLNKTACDCGKHRIDPRLEALKDLMN